MTLDNDAVIRKAIMQLQGALKTDVALVFEGATHKECNAVLLKELSSAIRKLTEVEKSL